MQLFEAVPSELFSVLASPNRELYADALDVLYEAYRDNLKISEGAYYMMLRSKLEQQLAQANFEGEDIDEEEMRDISGRARFLIRKLGNKGWFEKERGKDFNNFEEYLIVPGYSSHLLELFHQLRDDSPMRGYSYVFGTYSSLKVAKDSGTAYEKMMAAYSAYDNTMALIKMLKTVYHNVKRYFQTQIEMQNVNQVLSAHFDDFGQRVVEAYIRPLKIKDSVPKYRVPIQTILDEWLEDDGIILAMANAALQDKRQNTLETCRGELLEKMFWVKERYESIESDYLDEIDQQVRRYTRATTQKLENQEQVGLEQDVLCTVRDLLEKVVTDYAILSTRPNMDEVKRALTMLEQHNVLQRIEGKFSQPSCKFAILPTILIVVSSERLDKVVTMLRKEEGDDEEADEDTAD